MAGTGPFDPTAQSEGWFDTTAQGNGWFDPDLLQPAAAGGGGTFLSVFNAAANVLIQGALSA